MNDVSPIPKDPNYRSRKPPKRLPPRSQKRISEADQREEVRRITLERAGHRCQGPAAGLPERCRSIDPERPPLEVHEPRQRSTHPGSHLDASDTVALCQHHHDAVTSPSGDARVLAESLGLLIRATT